MEECCVALSIATLVTYTKDSIQLSSVQLGHLLYALIHNALPAFHVGSLGMRFHPVAQLAHMRQQLRHALVLRQDPCHRAAGGLVPSRRRRAATIQGQAATSPSGLFQRSSLEVPPCSGNLHVSAGKERLPADSSGLRAAVQG